MAPTAGPMRRPASVRAGSRRRCGATASSAATWWPRCCPTCRPWWRRTSACRCRRRAVHHQHPAGGRDGRLHPRPRRGEGGDRRSAAGPRRPGRGGQAGARDPRHRQRRCVVQRPRRAHRPHGVRRLPRAGRPVVRVAAARRRVHAAGAQLHFRRPRVASRAWCTTTAAPTSSRWATSPRGPSRSSCCGRRRAASSKAGRACIQGFPELVECRPPRVAGQSSACAH